MSNYRVLTPAEEAVMNHFWQLKDNMQFVYGYVTTTQALTLRRWNGTHPVEENTATYTVPAGSTLKIVMMSRMGDFGLTDDLDAERGYRIRLDWQDDRIEKIRLTREEA